MATHGGSRLLAGCLATAPLVMGALAGGCVHTKATTVVNPQAPGQAHVLLAGHKLDPSRHAIFVPAKATATEQTAAQELQDHLRLITGQQFPIMPETQRGERHGFFLGRSEVCPLPPGELAGLGLEGLVIESRGQDLVLAGNQRGVLYAVSVFLEDYLGCRWFTPDCMSVPQRGTLRIPRIQRRYVPPLEYRCTDYPHQRPAPFAMRCRFNGQVSELDEAHGGRITYHPFVHSFLSLVRPAEYYEKHPEYFSLVGGKRLRDNGQLCLTNPEVLKIAIAQVRQWIKDQPAATYVSVSQNDWANACQCEKCQALARDEGSEAGPLLHFVNAIADAIRDEHPDKVIDTLAYQYTRKPPRHVRPRPNVTVRLCTIECCFTHPLDSCPENQSFVEDIQGWSKICDRLSIWDYVISYNHTLGPFPNLYVLKPNIQFLIRNGVKSIYEEACYFSPGSELAELRTYIMAKTLWNPDYDTDRAINEFIAAYYGDAAPWLRQYVDLLHDGFREGRGTHVRIWGYDPVDFMPADFVPGAQALFQQARAAVADDPVRLQRVRVAQLAPLYMMVRGATSFVPHPDALVAAQVEGGPGDWVGEFRDIIRTAGVTSHQESKSINELLGSLASPQTRLPLEQLKNQQLAVTVLPAHGGRILHLVDLKSGYDWAKVNGNHGRVVPLGSGIEEYSRAPHQSPGCTETYEVVERRPLGLTLRARLATGGEFERRVDVAPDAPRVRIATTLTNRGTAALPVRLRIHPTIAVPQVSAARLLLRHADGQWRARALPLPKAGQPGSDVYFQGADRPAKEWGVLDDTTGRCLLGRLVGADAETYYVYACPAQSSLTMEWWSDDVELKPGASIGFEYEFEVLGQPPAGVPPKS